MGLTVQGRTEETVDTNRNGQRRTTTIEQTLQVPEYIVERNMLNKVETKFENGCLTVSWPEKDSAVDIPISFSMNDTEETVETEDTNVDGDDEELVDIEVVDDMKSTSISK